MTLFLTVRQTADKLGVSRQRVHQLIKRGDLKVHAKISNIFLVDIDSIDSYKPKPTGRPKLKWIKSN